MLHRIPILFLFAALIMAAPMIVGCDKELSHTQTTTTDSNGNKSTTEQKTVQKPDGRIETEKHTDTKQNQ